MILSNRIIRFEVWLKSCGYNIDIGPLVIQGTERSNEYEPKLFPPSLAKVRKT